MSDSIGFFLSDLRVGLKISNYDIENCFIIIINSKSSDKGNIKFYVLTILKKTLVGSKIYFRIFLIYFNKVKIKNN